MSRRIILSPDAVRHIRSAVRWYEDKQAILSLRFIAEIRHTLRRITAHPYEFPLVSEVVRRALLFRFPYSIYFKFDANGVIIIAVLHQRQSASLWMNRRNGSS